MRTKIMSKGSIIPILTIAIIFIWWSTALNAAPPTPSSEVPLVTKVSEGQRVILKLKPEANLKLILNWLTNLKTEGEILDFYTSTQNQIVVAVDSVNLAQFETIPGVISVIPLDTQQTTPSFASEMQVNSQTTDKYTLWLNLTIDDTKGADFPRILNHLKRLQDDGLVEEFTPYTTKNIIEVTTEDNISVMLQKLPGVESITFTPQEQAQANLMRSSILSEGTVNKTNLAGAITGNVTDEATDLPLEGIEVCVWSWTWSEPTSCATTDSNGNYIISAFYEYGQYVVFQDPTGTYQIEYFNDATDINSAVYLEVSTGEVMSDVDAALQTGGSISGTVTNKDGEPLPNILIDIYRNWQVIDRIETDDTGAYQTIGLSPGMYQMYLYDPSYNYLDQFYNNQYDLWYATEIEVVSDSTTEVNSVMSKGGTISGYVTDSTGNPIPNITVEAGQMDYYDWHQAYTDDNGYYEFFNLRAGDYSIHFYDWSGEYFDQGYDSLITLDVEEVVTDVNVTLERGGSVIGNVTDEAGNPIENVDVFVFDNNFWWSGWGVTDANGDYSVNGLPTGNYLVCFESPYDYNYNYQVYLRECYDNVPTGLEGQTINIIAENVTSGIDAVLTEAAIIEGTVSIDDGTPLYGGYVEVYHNKSGDWEFVRDGYINYYNDNRYMVTGLYSDTYRLLFKAHLSEYSYVTLDQYYLDAYTIDNATDIQISSGQHMTDVNMNIYNITGGISGNISDTLGLPLANIQVSAYAVNADTYAGWATTDQNGYYEFTNLVRGEYKIYFEDYNYQYLPEYYDSQNNFDTATEVTVAKKLTTTGIDAILSKGATVEGTVTSEVDNTPMAGVYACPLSDVQVNNWIPCTPTDENGFYRLSGLDNVPYTIQFEPPYNTPDIYVMEYYNDKTSWVEADRLTFDNEEVVTGIDASLSIGGKISGLVIDKVTGNPLPDVWTCAYSVSGNTWGNCATTDQNGLYTVQGLATDQYIVEFWDTSGAHILQYYDRQSNWGAAQPVQVTAGQLITGIDAALVEGGKVSGHIVNTNGDPLQNIVVEIYQNNPLWGWNWSGSASTDSQGNYTVGGLPTGDYRVGVYDWSDTYAQEFYNDAASLTEADDIPVTEGETTTGINIQLELSGNISGHVKSEDGETLSDVSIEVYRQQNQSGSVLLDNWELVNWGYTNWGGTYDITGLSQGTYRLRFIHNYYYYNSGVRYASEYYNDAWNLEDATDIIVASGDTTSDVDIVLQEGGHITGTVTNSQGETVPTVDIDVYHQINGEWVQIDWSYTDSNGNYDIAGLGTGAYRLHFYDWTNNYAHEYYANAYDVDNATNIDVVVGQTTPNIDIVLEDAVDPLVRIYANNSQIEFDTRTGKATVRQPANFPSNIAVEKDGVCSEEPAQDPEVLLMMNKNSYPMTETPAGSGTYRGTIPAQDLVDGARLQIATNCNSNSEDGTQHIGDFWFFRADPSGTVTDIITGDPIVEAAVTLYQVPGWEPKNSASDDRENTCESNLSKTVGEPWSQEARTDLGLVVDPIDLSIEPAINPLLTDEDGRYGWDVPKGCWYVVVEADGYKTITSPMVGAPPAVEDLDLALTPVIGAHKVYLPMLLK